MDTPDVDTALIADATAWALKKKRQLDPGLLTTVLELRALYDNRSAGSWPTGSAKDFVLIRWPAHGPTELPESDALATTMESFWRFLRGTGRMSSASAEPADLVKELRHALPGMAQACADRSNWSQGRVLGDFGASIGIDLNAPATEQELQDKLGQIMSEWNDLPFEERARLMPDVSPRTGRGVALTEMLNARTDDSDHEFGDDDVDPDLAFRRGDPGVAAREARESAYVNACIGLARWVGPRREVTSIGVLRPAVAREAFLELDLIEWELAQARDQFSEPLPMETKSRYARVAAEAIDSAANCVPLDRLWRAATLSGLIEVRRTFAHDTFVEPDTDQGWLRLACLLLLGLTDSLEVAEIDALVGCLMVPQVAPDGEAPIAAIGQWWLEHTGLDDRPVTALHGAGAVMDERDVRLAALHVALAEFDDTGVWVRNEGWLTITDLGREFAHTLAGALDEGMFDE